MQKQQQKHTGSTNRSQNGFLRHARPVVTEAYQRFATPSASPEDVRQRAYQKWEAAGKPIGDGISFWLEAEEELSHSR